MMFLFDIDIYEYILFFLVRLFHRELRDLRQQYENMAHELKRKDINLKELQTRLETGDGCKCSFITVKGFVLTSMR